MRTVLESRSPVDRLRGDAVPAQFARFVVVGGLSSAVYALVFLALTRFGDQAAVVAGRSSPPCWPTSCTVG